MFPEIPQGCGNCLLRQSLIIPNDCNGCKCNGCQHRRDCKEGKDCPRIEPAQILHLTWDSPPKPACTIIFYSTSIHSMPEFKQRLLEKVAERQIFAVPRLIEAAGEVAEEMDLTTKILDERTNAITWVI